MPEFNELKEELELAINNANISDYLVGNSNDVLSKIKRLYVKGDPRAWWLSLQLDKRIISFEDNTGYKHLGELVKGIQGDEYNPEKKVFFIVSDDDFDYIYNVVFNKIPSIIEGCRYFEYYVVAHDFSWLLCENDHGDVIICENG